MMLSDIVFITYEDRLQLLDGLKLLCASFKKHMPQHTLKVFLPRTSPDLLAWRNEHADWLDVEVVSIPTSGWCVKADLLAKSLSHGYKQVVWLDSDLLLTGSIERLFEEPLDVLVTAENIGLSDSRRAEHWGLPVKRTFTTLVNTCVIRVSQEHCELLRAWQQLMHSTEFKAVQAIPMVKRPTHVFSDQDVLEGLLMSNRFDHIRWHPLKEAVDLIHASGNYSISHRLKWRRREWPVLVHAHGLKPWMLPYRPKSSRRFDDVITELSPYCIAAKPYWTSGSLPEWMRLRTVLGCVAAGITANHAHWRAIPVMLLKRIVLRIGQVG